MFIRVTLYYLNHYAVHAYCALDLDSLCSCWPHPQARVGGKEGREFSRLVQSGDHQSRDD